MHAKSRNPISFDWSMKNDFMGLADPPTTFLGEGAGRFTEKPEAEAAWNSLTL